MQTSRSVRLINSDEFAGHLTTSEKLCEKDMGASGSQNSKTTQAVDLSLFEQLPEELIVHILKFVPAKDIILNLRGVCKSWKVIIDSKSLWIAKCHRDHVALPPAVLYDQIFPMDFKKLCVGKPFNRNLLHNWNGAGKTVLLAFFCSKLCIHLFVLLFVSVVCLIYMILLEDLEHWEIIENLGDGFATEEKAFGTKPLSEITERGEC